MKRKLLIWGASGHASVIADIVRSRGEYELVGFLDDVNPKRAGEEFFGATILGGQDRLEYLQEEGVGTVILGFGNCKARLDLAGLVHERGLHLATAVHPQAVVAQDVGIGAGTVIVAGAVVNPGARIGENVIVNTCASVGHDCIVGDAVHIGPGVRLAGGAVVGQATWLGIGATIVDRVRIGAGSIIGAGAVVLDNIPDGVVAYGVPARVVRKR